MTNGWRTEEARNSSARLHVDQTGRAGPDCEQSYGGLVSDIILAAKPAADRRRNHTQLAKRKMQALAISAVRVNSTWFGVQIVTAPFGPVVANIACGSIAACSMGGVR